MSLARRAAQDGARFRSGKSATLARPQTPVCTRTFTALNVQHKIIGAAKIWSSIVRPVTTSNRSWVHDALSGLRRYRANATEDTLAGFALIREWSKGLVPALYASKIKLSEALKQGATRVVGGRSVRLPRFLKATGFSGSMDISQSCFLEYSYG